MRALNSTTICVIDRLVEIRTVLERMRPVEHKLRYQIDKLLKIASSGKLAENDPLQFKANPGNLLNKVDDSGESSEEEVKETRSKKSGVYVPPKLAATPYGNFKNQTILLCYSFTKLYM